MTLPYVDVTLNQRKNTNYEIKILDKLNDLVMIS